MKKAAQLISQFCGLWGSQYTTFDGDCYYHAVLQTFLRNYTCKDDEEDNGAGLLALHWLKLIVYYASPKTLGPCLTELRKWIQTNRKNPHRQSLLAWLDSVIAIIDRLAHAKVALGTPTFWLFATYNEVDNHVHKKAGDGVKAKDLQQQGATQRAVLDGRVHMKVRYNTFQALARVQFIQKHFDSA
jgi:hypothetical protein